MTLKEVITSLEREKIANFLKEFNLEYQTVDHTIYLEEDDQIIGTVSSKENIITSFAISISYQEHNLANILISEIIKYLFSKGFDHLFIYTKPMYKKVFESLAFKEIIETDNVLILESNNRSIEEELLKLKKQYQIEGENLGAIVVNANPFTKGHFYLVEQASKRHEKLLVFVVEEDKSFFSFKDRFELVKRGTKQLENVIVLPSSKYIISNVTFPTYFLKKDVDGVKEQAYLDALIFKKYFFKIFHITKRYVGTETDLVTSRYNEALKTVFKDDLIEIPRIQYNGEDISASRVRKLFQEKNFDELKKIVVDTTYDYLVEMVNKQ